MPFFNPAMPWCSWRLNLRPDAFLVNAAREDAGLSEREGRLLGLLRTRGLSIKNLDEQRKGELRDLLGSLHNERGLSLTDVAFLIGNKTSGYTSWLCKKLGVPVRDFETARLKGIREKRRKYERLPFDGTDADKAYMLGLRHGDLSVSRPWKGVVRVSTSTTHPAMSSLFRSLLSNYGHVYEFPRFKESTASYEWNLQAILDDSFGFLDASVQECWAWVRTNNDRLLAYIAGVIDAEGHIGISRNYKTVAIIVSIYNTKRDFLVKIKSSLDAMGYRVLGPYLDKQKGTSGGKYRIMRRQDYWRIALASFNQCRSFLSQVPLRHPEKLARKRLALKLQKGCKWEDVRPKMKQLRKEVLAERDAYLKTAERQVRSRTARGRMAP